MPTWKVDTNAIRTQGNEVKQLASKLSGMAGSIRSTGNLNGIHFDGQGTVEIRIRQLCDSIETEASRTNNMGETLSLIALMYESNENGIKNNAVGISRFKSTQDSRGAGGSDGAGGGSAGGRGGSSESESDSDDAEKLVKAYLKLDGKINGNDNSTILKNGWSYLEDLVAYFSGDMRGWSGASELCDLAKSSSDLWTSLYKYMEKRNVLDSSWGKQVAGLGIAGSTVGFFGKLAKAFSSDNDTAYAEVANILDASSGLLDVGKSVYEFVNFAELEKAKHGLWTTAGNWATFGETVVGSLAQAVRSVGEYTADGTFDLQDLASTGIDVAVVGLEKLVSGVTFGIISEETIGATTDEMRAGIKNYAGNVGGSAGGYITKHQELMDSYQNGNTLEKVGITAYAVLASKLGW